MLVLILAYIANWIDGIIISNIHIVIIIIVSISIIYWGKTSIKTIIEFLLIWPLASLFWIVPTIIITARILGIYPFRLKSRINILIRFDWATRLSESIHNL